MSLFKILSAVARIFEPLGLRAPFVIYLKTLLQKLWRSGIIWDQDVRQKQIPSIEKWTR